MAWKVLDTMGQRHISIFLLMWPPRNGKLFKFLIPQVASHPLSSFGGSGVMMENKWPVFLAFVGFPHLCLSSVDDSWSPWGWGRGWPFHIFSTSTLYQGHHLSQTAESGPLTNSDGGCQKRRPVLDTYRFNDPLRSWKDIKGWGGVWG